jgi:hypothetical protein
MDARGPGKKSLACVGSALEERFDFHAPPGWQPPEAPQSARVVVQWRDALGEHRATSRQGVAFKEDEVMSRISCAIVGTA